MINLTDAQLQMLNTLIYLVDFVYYTEMKISDVVKNEYAKVQEWPSENKMKRDQDTPAMISKSEWIALFDGIKADSKLMNLTVTNPRSLDVAGSEEQRQKLMDEIGGYVDNTGLRAVCLVDDDGEAVVVFRGNGPDEWNDSIQGAGNEDTIEQKLALDYINSLEYNDLTVTGHSKGGNKAQYVTIMAGDKISKCVSVDGQGFSAEFIDSYREKIASNAGKIYAYNAEKDFVSPLLHSIVLEDNLYYIVTDEFDNILFYHKPNVVFDENWNFREEGEQSNFAKVINDLSIFYSDNYSNERYNKAMGEVITYFLSNNYSNATSEDFIISIQGMVLETLPEYFKENGVYKLRSLTEAICDVISEDKENVKNIVILTSGAIQFTNDIISDTSGTIKAISSTIPDTIQIIPDTIQSILDDKQVEYYERTGKIKTKSGRIIGNQSSKTPQQKDRERIHELAQPLEIENSNGNRSSNVFTTDVSEDPGQTAEVNKNGKSTLRLMEYLSKTALGYPYYINSILSYNNMLETPAFFEKYLKAADTYENVIPSQPLFTGPVRMQNSFIERFRGSAKNTETAVTEPTVDIKNEIRLFNEREVLPRLKQMVNKDDMMGIIAEELEKEAMINSPSYHKYMLE